MRGSHPLWPLLAFSALALAAVAFTPDGTSWRLVEIASALAATLVVAAWGVPWARLPVIFLVLPAVGALVLVGLLRHSAGGASSGYGMLAMLPVVWVALAVGRRGVVVMSAASAVLFAAPMLIWGSPMYPATGWRATALTLVVTSCVGLVVATVVAGQRGLAAAASREATALSESLAALAAVAGVARDISSGADPRERICAAALSSLDATLVTIGERRGDTFAITGGAGVSLEIQDAVEPAASLSAFFSQQRVFVPDTALNAGVSPLLIETTGVRSVVFEPIVRHGLAVGVLGVGWSTARDEVDAKTDAVISYLAAEAGSAIERADLLARLATQARTDDLTQLPNRRAWDLALASAIAERTPVCVAIMDIDHFKAFNDERGHLAGDRLLRECARAWLHQLRPGDVLARYGGEEFAVLVQRCTRADAELVLERIRMATPRAVTCSLGLAERRPFDTPESLLSRADSALYQAKSEGRDRLQAA
jgi:diguanylate cyclase (GGDEF)-like protein